MALSFFGKGVKEGLFDEAGVVEFDPIWAFEGVDIKIKCIVILGVQDDYKAINEAPNPQAGLEVTRRFSRAAFGAKWMAN